MLTPYQRHKLKWSKCERCPLCETRKNVVLVRGKLPCDVLLMGEAPGNSEDTLGKPFIGPAGKLLDRIIDDAGGNVARVRLAFTNVIACIPYDEEGKKVSEPPKEAIAECFPRLVDLVKMARPSSLVCVGQVPDKLLQKRADELWDVAEDQFPISQITHPAAILRANPAQQGLLYQKCVVTLREVFESLIPF